MKFISIGECIAELLPQAEADAFRLQLAGDTFNTAWCLKQLSFDISVSFFTDLDTDPISERLRDAISGAGIDTEYVIEVPDRTVGLYLSSLENGERSFSYWRGQSAARCMASDPSTAKRAIADHDLIYFSDITLAILDTVGREVLSIALGESRAEGQVIAFDPNLRPLLWENTDTMLQVVMTGAEVSDIALSSYEDEATWVEDTSPKVTAKRYQSAGASTVVVKNGTDSIYCQSPKGENTISDLNIAKVIDTNASGDSFNAAILAGLSEGFFLPDTIEKACALSGAVVQAHGALVPVTKRQDHTI